LPNQPGKLPLSPADHTLILIDHQSQMAFATKSIDPVLLRKNDEQVAKAAKDFSVSTISTTVASKTFSGPIRHPETPSGSRRLYALAAKAIRHLKPLVREEGLTPNDRGVLWDPRAN
jgi:nicotinamidase-related amidase